MKPWKTLEPGTKIWLSTRDGLVLENYWTTWDGKCFTTCAGTLISAHARWCTHKSEQEYGELKNLDFMLEQLIVEYGI